MKHREVPGATSQILEVIFRLGFVGTDLSEGRGNLDLGAGERETPPAPKKQREGGGGGGGKIPSLTPG